MTELEAVSIYITRYIQMTDEEAQYLMSLLRVTRVRRKQCIVQPEFICKYRSYVFSGAMRAYLVDDRGVEHTIAFAIEDWWISDYSSYIFQRPATLFVEAIEESVLVQLDYNAEQLLLETYPRFEKFFRIITQRSFAFLQQRMLASLSMTAEQRYEYFMAKYAPIALRVPQYALASYLGMTTEYLSRLRNQRATRKS